MRLKKLYPFCTGNNTGFVVRISKKSGEKPLNLETFDLDFDVDRFYSPELEKAKQYNAQQAGDPEREE